MNRLCMNILSAVTILCTVCIATGTAQTYTYDEAGRLSGVAYSDGSTISYSYDANGNLLERISRVLPGSAEETGNEEPTWRLTAGPNPAPGGITFFLSGPAAGPMLAAVINADGKQVAELAIGNAEMQRGELYWNGTDGSGNPLPSGVYHVRLYTPDGLGLEAVAAEKIVLLR